MSVSLEGASDNGAMNIEQIMAVLPHRAPFLLLDRVTFKDGMRSAKGLKNLTANDWVFQGHYSDRPQMPKTILVEVLAQLGAACVLANEEYAGRSILFASIDDCWFGKAPVPGDTLELEVENRGMRRDTGKMLASCYVNGEKRASGILMFALGPRQTESK